MDTKKPVASLLLILSAAHLMSCSVDFSVPTTVTHIEEVESDEIDLDLASMSGTVVYSAVYDMLNDPDRYRGQKVRMKGQFMVYHYEDTGNYYFTCLIQDATACCQQGLEFTYSDEYEYPRDFPEPGDDITVYGTYDTYEEDGYTFCYLKDSMIFSD